LKAAASRHYCTYFDRRYLLRGLALHASLAAHGNNFVLEVLCLDKLTLDLLTRLRLPGVRLISLAELEACDPELLVVKAGRPAVEYIWTLTPSWIRFVMQTNPSAGLVTYLDADLWFYSSPEPLFEELGAKSISLIPHRFAKDVARMTASSGVFNVGMMSFRDDGPARVALGWWRDRCLEACYSQSRDGVFGDQKYLDDWPQRFSGVCIIRHKGANLAPWNIDNYKIAARNGQLWVDEQPLIFYHFHQLERLSKNWFRSGVPIARRNIDLIYRPYLAAMQAALATIWSVQSNYTDAVFRPSLSRVLSWCYYRQLTFMRSAWP
jgi:hypothetical protein